MCGIVGYISNSSIDLKSNLNLMNHRGPDASKSKVSRHNKLYIGLGHCRLSIIDLDEKSDQPFNFKDKYEIIFNGEIYNFIELRNELIKQGYVFNTKSDTEVLITAYDFYGMNLFDHLNGMYAFAILDKINNKVILARDHLGIKPLYYFLDKKKLFFASELKSLFNFKSVKKKISKYDITEFLFNGWLYEPNTGFQNIIKIMPGEALVYDLISENTEKIIYFDVINDNNNIAHEKTTNELIERSLDIQCRSDVPLGIFFSGGVDSTVIASKVKEAKCITARYNNNDLIHSGMGNDYDYSMKIANKTNLDMSTVTLPKTIYTVDEIKRIVKLNEELISDFTFQISEMLAYEAKSKGFKVMLSGMGADELYGGYPRYKLVKYKTIFKIISYFIYPFRFFLNKFSSFNKKTDRFFSFLSEKNFIFSYSSLVGYFNKTEIEKIIIDRSTISIFKNKISKLLEKVSNESDFKKAFYLDLYGFLPHNFIVADKSSMQASIELRVPLVNKHILYENFRKQDSFFINILNLKKPLKKILMGLFSKSIINRKKTGLNPPLEPFFNVFDCETLKKVLKDGPLKNFLKLDYVFSLVDEHYQKKKNNTYKLWQLLYLNFWIEENEN